MRKISHTQNKEPFLEYILSEIRFKKASKYIKDDDIVADLGCGYRGSHLKRIANKIKLGIGYDISVLNKNLPKNIILKKVDINKKFVVKNNYFDTVLALAVIEHVENPRQFLLNINKMLNRDGKVIITTPHRFGKIFLELLSKTGFISSHEIEDHKNYFDKRSLQVLLKNTGFKIEKLSLFGLSYLNLICVARKSFR